MKTELETYKLSLIRDGKLPGAPADEQCSFDVGEDLRLVPKFNERKPDTFLFIYLFFTIFDRIADVKQWPDADRTDQCVLTCHCHSFSKVCN